MNYLAFLRQMLYYIAMKKEKENKSIQSSPEFANLKTDFHYSFMEYAAKYVSPLHYHNVYELYFLESGTREYIINGEVYTVNAGTLVLIPPGVLHETSGTPFKRKLMHFSRKALEQYYNHQTVNELLSACSSFIYTPNENMPLKTVEAIFQQTRMFFLRGDFQGCIESAAYLLHGLRCMEVGKPKSSSHSSETIEQIVSYIQKNATTIDNLEEISHSFFISKSHLCHLFKQQTGITVYDFLLRIKIEKASNLLATTKRKIKDICQECGFNSEYYFSRRFLMATGISPSKYRKEFSVYNQATTHTKK